MRYGAVGNVVEGNSNTVMSDALGSACPRNGYRQPFPLLDRGPFARADQRALPILPSQTP